MTGTSVVSEAKSQVAVDATAPINNSTAMEDMQPTPTFPTGRLGSDSPSSSSGLASHDNWSRDEDKRMGSREKSMTATKPAGREVSPRDRIRQIDNDIVKVLLGLHTKEGLRS